MKNLLSILLSLSWSLVTTVLLCLPGSAFPQENWFAKIALDKWIHVFLFAVMVTLWCQAFRWVPGKRKPVFIQVAFYFILYGIAMEFVQKYLIPNRSFDPGDILADAAGAAIGLFISLRVYIKK